MALSTHRAQECYAVPPTRCRPYIATRTRVAGATALRIELLGGVVFASLQIGLVLLMTGLVQIGPANWGPLP